MKAISIFTIMICVGIVLPGCKKYKTDPVYLDGGSVNIINATIGAPTLTLLTQPSLSSAANNSISGNNYAILPIASAKEVSLSVGIPGIAASNSTSGVPPIIYYSQTVPVDNTTSYSLFLTGDSVTAIDNVLIRESYTPTYPDSVCGVRFINLAPGSSPISVNIQGNANGSEIPSLAYKSYSEFIQHPAKTANISYVFEFRDAVSGTLITTYTLPVPYFHNVTLALRGKVGGITGIIMDRDF